MEQMKHCVCKELVFNQNDLLKLSNKTYDALRLFRYEFSNQNNFGRSTFQKMDRLARPGAIALLYTMDCLLGHKEMKMCLLMVMKPTKAIVHCEQHMQILIYICVCEKGMYCLLKHF